ncbi:MAG TPA: lactate racemase domain-containing protein [Actinomycetota bacterium]|nr:lactate racemase domain-containing protein [Actinomycetota bacterium]
MARPGFVLEVDERTPPLLVHQGEGFRLEKFPLGSRVIYPPDALPKIRDVRGAIRHALANPHGSEPLAELLKPGMKLTIAIDDISLPLPPMQTPDVRQLVLEEVIELAARQGVEDIKLYMANSLHRRMTGPEIKHAVGERVYRSFYPKDLKNHDAEDPDNLLFVGTTDKGEEVELNKRAAESDLLVYVNINLVALDGGHKSVGTGLASYRSVRHHHNVHTLLHSNSYMDPREGHSAIHDSLRRMGTVIADAGIRVFTIETTLNNDTFPEPFGFMNKREWEWSVKEQATYLAARKLNDLGPSQAKHQIWMRIRSPHGVTGVNAGATDPVHERTLARLHEQQLVEVDGQSDIMVIGLPYLGPYNVNSIMNPILVHCLGPGYVFNMYRNKPVVRPGGVMIMFHPVPWEFHQVHHPSYVDFFEEVLAETTDPATIESKFEEHYATDPWYIHLYRKSYAYHGVHPFYMWYWGAHALDYLGDVIVVGGNRRACERMGYRAATTFKDALEMAGDTVGRSPSIAYFHMPPFMIADVR